MTRDDIYGEHEILHIGKRGYGVMGMHGKEMEFSDLAKEKRMMGSVGGHTHFKQIHLLRDTLFLWT